MVQDKAGKTRYAHLMSVAKKGRRPPELDGPPIPPVLRHVWDWFQDLVDGRPPNERLTYQEIGEWARLTGERPTPYEVKLLKAMDRTYRKVLLNGRRSTD